MTLLQKVIALVFFVLISSAVSADDTISRFAEIYKELDGFYGKLEKFGHAVSVYQEIQEGKQPKQKLLEFGKLNGIVGDLDKMAESISNLNVHFEASASDYQIPSLSAFDSPDLNTRLDALSKLIAIQRAESEKLGKVLETFRHLKKISAVSDASWKSLRVISDFCLKTNGSGADLFDTFGFKWFEIEAEIMLKVSAIDSNARAKITKLVDEDQKFRASAAYNDFHKIDIAKCVENVHQRLIFEQDQLEQWRAKLEGEARELSAEGFGFLAASDLYEKYTKQYYAREIAIARSASDLEDQGKPLSRKLKSVSSRLHDCEAAYNKKREEFQRINLLFRRYTYCPNGEPFEKCIHEDLKAKYVREGKELQERYTSLARETKDLESKINSLKAELASVQSEITTPNENVATNNIRAREADLRAQQRAEEDDLRARHRSLGERMAQHRQEENELKKRTEEVNSWTMKFKALVQELLRK